MSKNPPKAIVDNADAASQAGADAAEAGNPENTEKETLTAASGEAIDSPKIDGALLDSPVLLAGGGLVVQTIYPVPVFTHRIAAVVDKGFYRAGRFWPREGVDINEAEFTEAQLKALAAEPMLIIKQL